MEDKSSSASQSSNTELPILIDVNQQENYIRLINTALQDQRLGGWKLEMEVNEKIISFTFKSSFKLSSRRNITMSGTGCYPYDPTELSWKDLTPWNSGDNLKFTLISNTDVQHQLNFYSLKDSN
ncbi:lamin-B3-like [Sebastes fasciatus]|uniref:lamin-B3-like n=1 Tax=Sebastes fasciatus TaxID=394691 RepID=UPI003D9E53A8